ncbi:MAG: hypothetical protein LV481_14355 [Methylacidiphilales bacterium]|nr:hypothetical protein [Candidatus Methylacidiphilales bacterium]
MSIFNQFQLLLHQSSLTRRQALLGLSLLGLAACSRSGSTPAASSPGIAYYTCSMHPSVHSPVPGKCPICGMDLIPVTSGRNGTKDSVYFSPEQLQALDVAVVVVERKTINGVDSLAVPAGAVLPTGNYNFIFVDLGSGYIAPREIKIGVQSQDGYQVLSGLREGDRVLSGAVFLIDAECRNQGILTTWGDNT